MNNTYISYSFSNFKATASVVREIWSPGEPFLSKMKRVEATYLASDS